MFARVGPGIGVAPMVNAGAFLQSQGGGSAWSLSCVRDVADCLSYCVELQLMTACGDTQYTYLLPTDEYCLYYYELMFISLLS